MYNGIFSTDFQFNNQISKYEGKVRDVYHLDNKIVMIVTDRVSCFDVILPKPIPFKGQILNQIAKKFLKITKDIVPNWVESVPDPNATIGKKCNPFEIEMVIRGYLSGHAWREYKLGKRELCGVELPNGMKENDKFPSPIITPSSKAQVGHDIDLSKDEIIQSNLISKSDYKKLEEFTYALFEKGTEYAKSRGLLLIDTKYEFGLYNEKILLIDEIHTPDSSRYFYEESYEKLQDKGEKQRQLSKEFLREWLIENEFQGNEGEEVPEMNDEIINSVSERYIELYENLIGEKFEKRNTIDILNQIEKNVNKVI
mgnify:FL=1|tara:strand:- start:1077 stop:2012 length:936 start_codon:yes stop_codon:yes gene_type:complete